MLPEAWELLDQMRGSSSRGTWIAARVHRDFNAASKDLSNNSAES
jgi:hypothetical protein